MREFHATVGYASKSVINGTPRSTREIIQSLESSRESGSISPDKFLGLLDTVRYKSKSTELVAAYSRALLDISRSLSTDETIKVVSELIDYSANRQEPETLEILKRVTSNLVRHGASSFSLDAILEFFKLTRRLGVDPDPLFKMSLFQRVLSVNPSSEPDQVEYIKYLVRLNRVHVDSAILKRVKALLTTEILSYDVRILSDLLILCDAHKLADNDELRIEVLNALETVFTRVPMGNILKQAVDIHVLSPFFELFMSALESRIDNILADSSACALLLDIVCKRGALPGFVFSRFDSICLNSLLDQTQSISTISAIARICRDSVEISDVLRSRLTCTLLECSNMPLDSSKDIERFVKLVEATTIFNIQDAGLTGILARRISDLHSAGRLTDSFWKLACWWQLTRHRLPINSIIPNVVNREFPQTMSALSECSVDSLVQPVSGRFDYTTHSLCERLRSVNAPYTQFPKIGSTSLRAHLRVALEDGSACYVILTRNGRILQISADSNVSIRMLEDCVSLATAKLSLMPIEIIPSLFANDVIRTVQKYLHG